MRLVAADLSASTASLALLVDGEVREEWAWRSEPGRHADFFTRLREAMARHAWTPAAVDVWAVGRGPGNFSGLRTVFAAWRAISLPSGAPVRAVSSGRVMATQVLRARPDLPGLAVIGDARRESLWHANFLPGVALRAPAPADYGLLPLAEAEAALAGVPLVLSPDASRLRERVAARWHPGEESPSAGVLAEIVWAEWSEGAPGEPAEPIYLHPAVRTPPG
jgi:tRNA threonylcarbamoyl adenosine modification protein YeaZ